MKIRFNDKELEKIGKAAKHNKFKIEDNDILYAGDSEQKVGFFIMCFRYLHNIMNSVDDEDIKLKIEEYLQRIEGVYDEAQRLLLMHARHSVSFGKHKLKEDIDCFVARNSEVMMSIADAVLPMGRVVPYYDPSESGGYL